MTIEQQERRRRNQAEIRAANARFAALRASCEYAIEGARRALARSRRLHTAARGDATPPRPKPRRRANRGTQRRMVPHRQLLVRTER
jgi:hypothetical protein